MLERMIHELEHTSGAVDIHFTSELDTLEMMISIICGRVGLVFASHLKSWLKESRKFSS